MKFLLFSVLSIVCAHALGVEPSDVHKDGAKDLIEYSNVPVTDDSGFVPMAGKVTLCCNCRNRCPQGPPGPCPSITQVPVNSSVCPTGGVKLKCAGEPGRFVCNGAPGAATCPTMTQLPIGDTQCPNGGVSLQCPGGLTRYVCNGANGTQGPPGSNGIQGPPGSQGFNGTQGERGFNGTQGPQGERGFNGTQGPQGERGFNGTQGERGFNGTEGPQGESGAKCPVVSAATGCANGGLLFACNGTNTTVCFQNGTLVHHTAFVDSTYGNDATARLESPNFPFQTVQAAIDAAAPFATFEEPWQIQIRPGIYTEDVHLRDFTNLLGISAIGFFGPPIGAEEVEIQGSIDDALLTPFFDSPDITGLTVTATEKPALLLNTSIPLTVTNCIFSSTYTNSATATAISIFGEFTGLVLQQSSVTLNINYGSPFVAAAISLDGFATSLIVQFSKVDVLVFPGAGTPTIASISSKNSFQTKQPAITSSSIRYSIGFIPIGFPATSRFEIFALDNAAAISQNDNLQIIDVPANIGLSLANLGASGGTVQQVDIVDMVVNSAATILANVPSAINTLDNNGLAGSTGYFANIRFRNFDGDVPTQTPQNFANTFRQVDILGDAQEGGQDLLTTVTVTANYTVAEIDAVVFWKGALNGEITLPAASKYTGRRLTFKDASTISTVDIKAAGADAIDSGTLVHLTPLQSLVVVSDGVNTWWIV